MTMAKTILITIQISTARLPMPNVTTPTPFKI
jgi:hypothetical protein